MRAVAEYELAEWARGLPLAHGFKRVRNAAVELTFRRLRPHGFGGFRAELAERRPQTIAAIIAFNTPWVIDVATRMAAKNLNGTLIVCDNSRNRAARVEIERICRERGVPYIGLPFSLERHPCRSHGIAINWVYYNIIQPLEPRVFGFLDHDLFPLQPLDLAALVAEQPVYGKFRSTRWGWYLWAGFCVFDRAAIATCAPDFNTDIPRLLDTGGRNWLQIYRRLDRAGLRFSNVCAEWLKHPVDGTMVQIELVDDCLHVGGVSTPTIPHAANDRVFIEGIVRHVSDGGTLADLKTTALHAEAV